MPRPPALLRTSVAPAPSPNSTAVARSVQSMIEVSFSEATTSTCSACSEATSPSATLSAYRKPVHAAWTSNAPACLAPSRAWRSQALLGAKHAVAFDVQAACTGFLYALNVAEGHGV